MFETYISGLAVPAPLPSEPLPLSERRAGLGAGALFGFPIGVLSGFTGVGGGEYRAPVLLWLMGKVRWSIAANLLVGIIVSVVNFAYRGGWTLRDDFLVLATLLIATSLPGGYVGATITKRTSSKALKGMLAAILVITGIRLIFFETEADATLVLDLSAAILALALGFVLGMISGLLGLAAGEYRIPALILLFGVPPIVAGTISSLAAVPQQLVAFLKHRQLRHTGRSTLRLGAVMGAASAFGVILGVSLLGRTSEAFVTQVLGVAMILAATRILWDIRYPHVADEPETVPGTGSDRAA